MFFNFPSGFLICVGVIIITEKIAMSGLLALGSVLHKSSTCVLLLKSNSFFKFFFFFSQLVSGLLDA